MESIVLALGFLGTLVFIYFHIREENKYINKLQDDLTKLPIELQKFYSQLEAKSDIRIDKLLSTSFKDYLAHIRELEKMTLPKPVDEKEIKKILDRVEPLVENDIEKEEKEGIDISNGNLSGISFNNVNVGFESEFENSFPTEVE